MTTTLDRDALADATARIDHVLATTEALPVADGDWLPGDPLWPRPRGDGYDEQTVRPMIDLLTDRGRVWLRCAPCQVSWVGPELCWVCKRPRMGSRATRVVLDEAQIFTPSPPVSVSWRLVDELSSAAERIVADMELLVESISRGDA